MILACALINTATRQLRKLRMAEVGGHRKLSCLERSGFLGVFVVSGGIALVLAHDLDEHVFEIRLQDLELQDLDVRASK